MPAGTPRRAAGRRMKDTPPTMQAFTRPDSSQLSSAPSAPAAETTPVHQAPDMPSPGKAAPAKPKPDTPLALRWADWRRIISRTARSLVAGPSTLVAAGCAFYSTLSLFPAISALISIYGLAFDVQTVTPQMDALRPLLPPSVFMLIQNRVQVLVAEPHTSLTLNLIISLTVALWSASAATRSIISALNMAYNAREHRNFFVFQATAFALTLFSVLGAVLTIALMVAIPLLLNLSLRLHIPTPPGSTDFLSSLSGPLILFTFEILALSTLYRYGPDRQRRTGWRWVMPGAVLASFVLIPASQLFSYYVAHLASYNTTYGPLGAFIVIMMWFFVTAWVVLMGAELNAEMESYARGNPRLIVWHSMTPEGQDCDNNEPPAGS